jgi:7,8-dihydro-6-hydroxymethylpterin-pyrophosphokinase
VDLDIILYGVEGIEYNLDYILFNPAASIISKWKAFKLLRWSQLLNRFVDLDIVLYGVEGIEYNLEYILYNPVETDRRFRGAYCTNHWNEKVPLKHR